MKKIFLIVIILLLIGGVFSAPPEITQLIYSPSPAIPGSIINVFIQLENNEKITQTDVIVELKNNYPFEVKEENKKNIGNMTSYGKALTKFKVYVDPSAENMIYELPITITSKEQPIGKTVRKEIFVKGVDPLIKVTNISEQKLIPGQEKEIIFTIKNVGTSTAHDIIIELKEDRTIVASGNIIEREITPLGSAIEYITKLEPKQEEKRVLKVSVNREAQLKNYTIPITINYMNNYGERKEEITNIGFKVSGEVDFDLIIREKIFLVEGQTHDLTFELFNKGPGKAEFTIVELETPIGFFERKKQFIGSLAPNDIDSFKTNLIVNSGIQSQENTIFITIEYQDSDAITKIKKIELPVQIYSLQEWNEKQGVNPLQNILIVVIVLIIIATVIGYKKIKKR